MLIRGSPEVQRPPGGGYGLGDSLWDDGLGPSRCCLLPNTGAGKGRNGTAEQRNVPSATSVMETAGSGQLPFLLHPLTNLS